jgi:hypothetical protein
MKKQVQLSATYQLVNILNGVPQSYYAGRNIKGLTEAQIRETIKEGMQRGSKEMVMIDKTVIVSDRQGRIHFTFEY